MTRCVTYIVYGEPASKANSRRIVRIGKRMASIKSAKALSYADAFVMQAPVLDELLEGEIRADITIYYASQRPDLDESLILDLLQGRAYRNDRQVRERHVYHEIDRERPRAEIVLTQRERRRGNAEAVAGSDHASPARRRSRRGRGAA